jgi:hypothetical protein
VPSWVSLKKREKIRGALDDDNNYYYLFFHYRLAL